MTIEFDELQVADGGRDPSRGRRRAVAGIAAAMLIAAAGGVGYGVGRAADRDASTVGADEGGAADADNDGAGETSDASAAPTTAATTVERTAPERSSVDDMADVVPEPAPIDGSLRSSGVPGYPAFGTQPMATLYERATAGGFLLRVQLGQTWDAGLQSDWGAGDWRPAPWCYESGQMRVSMVGNGVVDVGGVPWYAEPFGGRAVSWLQLGGNDSSPQWVIVAQTPPDITSVRVTFADGAADQTEPQAGIAVLTVPGEASTPVDEGDSTYWVDPTPEFEMTFEGGAEPITVTSNGMGPWEDPEFRESCTPPPPALPEPGDQPADPAAADAEIRAAMALLYGALGDGIERADFIDDPTGVAEAREQVQAGGYATDAAGAEATIDELVFTAPAEAWFRYSIDTPGNDFDNRYGIAVAIDGVWKITRATVCQDLSLAGGDCGAGWEPIYPPSAYDGVRGEFGEESTDETTEESVTPATTILLDD